jgi:hypothetical protein
MRFWTLLAVVLTVAVVGESALLRTQNGKKATADTKDERIAALIRQLGDEKFAVRQAASNELEAIGEPALAALRKAAASGDNPEIRRRAEQLVRAIQPRPVRLNSALVNPGLPLAESKYHVYSVHLTADVNGKGEGKGKLTLHVTPPNFDEYGDFVTGGELDNVNRPQKDQRPPVVLDCAVEFVKTGFVGRVNTPPTRRSLFRLKGPKITSGLFVTTTGPGLTSGRLLVLGKDQRVEYVVDLTEFKPRGEGEGVRPIPCHPGCFPAGTLVLVPGGSKRIELIRKGETVTTIGPDGRPARGVVREVFTSKNQLVEVRTDNGTVMTTAAQPLCLVEGGFRKAGDLKAGDRVWQWRSGRRVETAVRAVAATGKEAPVFNLILGDSAVFVAGNFLARGKPPAEGSVPVVGATTPPHPVGRPE